jgi:hypothetical protein
MIKPLVLVCRRDFPPTTQSKCEIIKEVSWKLVATAARTSSNIYVLSEIGNEKCFLGKEDESWLWKRRMGNINFDNLAKVRK